MLVGTIAAAVTVFGGEPAVTTPVQVESDTPSHNATASEPIATAPEPVADDEPELEFEYEAFYVSPELGDDSNDGTSLDQPWQSLQDSLDRLKPGQALYLMDGEYTGPHADNPAHFVVRVDGEPDAWIKVAAAPNHTPVLLPYNGNGLVVKDADYIEVEGLTVRGVDFDKDNAYGWGLLVRNSHHVKFIGNTISDMPVGGISSVESSHITIDGNTTFNNSYWGTEQGSGISIWHSVDYGFDADDDGYTDRVINNISYGNENKVFSRWHPGERVMSDGNGIIVDESIDFGYKGRFLVANNISFNNGGRGIAVMRTERVDILHNTTFHNGRTERLTSPASEIATTYSSHVRLMNNLAISSPGVNDWRVLDVSKIESGGNIWITESSTGWATSADIVTTEDPGLVEASIDPESFDYRLTANSIAIDAAIDIPGGNLKSDFDGATRPQGEADVGAFEYQKP